MKKLIDPAIPIEPVVAYLAACSFPVLQYLLTIRLGLPLMLTSFFLSLCVWVAPAIFHIELFPIFCNWWTLSLGIGARMLDVGMMSRRDVASWTLSEFLEYIITLDNVHSRKIKTSYWNKVAKLRGEKEASCILAPNEVLQKDRTLWYYAGQITRWTLELVLWNLLFVYTRDHRAEHRPPVSLFWFNDVNHFVDMASHSLMLFLMLDLAYGPVTHVFAEVYQVPYVPLFENPLGSKSVRDYWGVRWNRFIRESLQRITFRPSMAFFKSWNGNGKRVRYWQYCLSTLSTFFLSGILHEYIVFVLGDEPSGWSQIMFFMSHGIWVLAEDFVVDVIKAKTGGWDLVENTPAWIRFLYTSAVFCFTGSLFFNALLNGNVYHKISEAVAVM